MDDSQVLRSMMRDDAYRVVKVLGEGAGGKTELVTLDGEKLLVRKRIPSPLDNAAAWASLMGYHAPHLPSVESIYQMPDELVVVYTYVEGQSLRDTVKRMGALAPRRAADIVCDVCEAATTLHTRGIIHRDITPSNIIIATDGAYLVDLGIARQHVEGQEHDTTTLGTWGFAAPEQYGFAQTDERSDVYALGRLLGYALTGAMPGSEAYDIALSDRARVPEALAQVAKRASSFEPSARYQDTDALEEAIRSALAGAQPSEARGWQGEVHAPAGKGDGKVGGGPAYEKATASHDTARAKGTDRKGRSASNSSKKHVFEAAIDRLWAPGTGRRLSDAPLPTRLLVIVAATCTAFLEVLFVGVSFASLVTRDPSWTFAHYAICLITEASLFMLCREVYLSVTQRGPYTQARRVKWLLLQRTCIIIAITSFLMFLASIGLPSKKS